MSAVRTLIEISTSDKMTVTLLAEQRNVLWRAFTTRAAQLAFGVWCLGSIWLLSVVWIVGHTLWRLQSSAESRRVYGKTRRVYCHSGGRAPHPQA